MAGIDHIGIDPHERLNWLNGRIIWLKEETAKLMLERKNINLAADWEEDGEGFNDVVVDSGTDTVSILDGCVSTERA